MKGSIPYGRQEINNDDIQAVIEILKADFLTQGPKVEEFETKFASYIGSKYAVAVANGTAALHLSTLAMGVKKDKKVITTPISFAATANCIEYPAANSRSTASVAGVLVSKIVHFVD